jgi:predicted  nucleic acid-binding Zn-ribbon protein
MLDTLNLTKKSTMDGPLIVQFQDVVQSRKVLSDHLNKFCERMPSLLHEQRDLNAEIQLVNQKINRLTKEMQRPLFERAKWKTGVEIQGLKNKMETITKEASDMDVVIKEYRNQQQEIWKKMNEAWEKQCEIWYQINASKIPNSDE